MKHLLLILPLLLAGCTSSPDATGETGIQPTSPGHAVFLNQCLVCHQGVGNPPGPNRVLLNSEKLASLEGFEAYLRDPDTNLMPAFPEGQLADEDVALLYEYLKPLQAQ